MTGSAQRFQNLQLLRCIASLGVVFAHVELYEFRPQWIFGDFFAVGAFGVDIFFVISGFIMVHVSKNRTENRVIDAASFFLKRLARIAPLYFLFTLLTIACAYLMSKVHFAHNYSLGEHFSVAKTQLPYIVDSLTFSRWDLQPIFEVGWTLQYEFWFYIVFAICILCGANVYLFFGTYAVGVLAANRLGFWQTGVGSELLNPLMLEFVLGIFLYLIYETSSKLKVNERSILFLVGFASFLLLGADEHYFVDAVPGDLLRPVFHGAAAFCVVYLFLALEGRMIPGRICIFFGDASYSIYLTHWFVLGITNFVFWKIGWFPTGSVAGCVFISVGIAMASSAAVYLWIEKPSNQLISSALSGFFNRWRQAGLSKGRSVN